MSEQEIEAKNTLSIDGQRIGIIDIQTGYNVQLEAKHNGDKYLFRSITGSKSKMVMHFIRQIVGPDQMNGIMLTYSGNGQYGLTGVRKYEGDMPVTCSLGENIDMEISPSAHEAISGLHAKLK